MSELPVSYSRLLDKVVEKLTPEYVMSFKVSEEEAKRADILLDRNNAGIITDEEKAELNAIVEFDKFMTILKAKALLSLNNYI